MQDQVTVCCVWTGHKYSSLYVSNLYSMVDRYLDRPFRFVCLHDQKFTDCFEPLKGIEFIDVSEYGLTGWWSKMLVFDFNCRIFSTKTIFLDLDTVIVNRLEPLIDVDSRFAISKNFTKMAGHKTWPCNYGSCVMVLGQSFGHHIAYWFKNSAVQLMKQAGKFGDQLVIEQLYPDADYLQDLLPPGYLVGRREFGDKIPDGAALMIFAGKTKPHDFSYSWIAEFWR